MAVVVGISGQELGTVLSVVPTMDGDQARFEGPTFHVSGCRSVMVIFIECAS